jgi:hypothetical protein
MDQYTKEEKENAFKFSVKLTAKNVFEIYKLLELAHNKHIFSMKEAGDVARITSILDEGFKLAVEHSKKEPVPVPVQTNKPAPTPIQVQTNTPIQVRTNTPLNNTPMSIEERLNRKKPMIKMPPPPPQQQYQPPPSPPHQQYQPPPQQQYQQQHPPQQQRQLTPHEQQFVNMNQQMNANIEQNHTASLRIQNVPGIYNPQQVQQGPQYNSNAFNQRPEPQTPSQLISMNPRAAPNPIGNITYNNVLETMGTPVGSMHNRMAT